MKLGHFCVNDTVITPLNQEELADGWRMVLPKSSQYKKQHFFNIQLSHLPEHLWRHVNTRNTYKHESVDTDNKNVAETYYETI